MKRQVRVCVIHPLVKDGESIYDFLRLDHLKELPYEIVMDNVHPEVVIVTELFYTTPAVRERFAELYCDQVVTVFIAGECVAPDLNLFDYAVCFDNYGQSDRVISVPYRKHFREYLSESQNAYTGKIGAAQDELSKKTGFCNFIYSNPSGHKSREEIFTLMNSYKKVDSLGAFLNNTGFHDGKGCSFEEKVRNSIFLKAKYKFTIAFENEISRGYTTEKVFMALEAHSIPIYWGNPEISEIVNEKAIINCHQYESFQQVLERVKEIDQDDALWCQMVSEPWMTTEQEERERAREQNYNQFLERIFLQKHPRQVKRGVGTFADRYRDFILGSAAAYENKDAQFQTCMRWILMHQQGKGLNSFFQKGRYETVAIYGMGAIGIAAYSEIRKCETVKMIYGIDQGLPAVPGDMKCFRLYEMTEDMRPDVVLNTVLHHKAEIAETIQKRFSCDVYNIADVLGTIMKESHD